MYSPERTLPLVQGPSAPGEQTEVLAMKSCACQGGCHLLVTRYLCRQSSITSWERRFTFCQVPPVSGTGETRTPHSGSEHPGLPWEAPGAYSAPLPSAGGFSDLLQGLPLCRACPGSHRLCSGVLDESTQFGHLFPNNSFWFFPMESCFLPGCVAVSSFTQRTTPELCKDARGHPRLNLHGHSLQGGPELQVELGLVT